MRNDYSFSIGKLFFHWIHYSPRQVKEPWKFGCLIGKNPSGLFGRGITCDFYIGRHLYVLVISKDL